MNKADTMLKAGGLSIDFDDIHFAFCVSAWDQEEGKKEQEDVNLLKGAVFPFFEFVCFCTRHCFAN